MDRCRATGDRHAIDAARVVNHTPMPPSLDDREAAASGERTSLGSGDRWQPLLLLGSIGLGLVFAQWFPALAKETSPLVTVGVFVLIYLVMLDLDLSRLALASSQRRFLGIAIALNFIVNPVLAWTVGQVFLGGHPDLRVGLLLFLVTPCIGWYLIFTELAGGDLAMGIRLLGVNLVLQILLLPLYLFLFEGQARTVDVSGIIASVAAFLVVPALLASATRVAVERAGRDLAAVQRTIDRTQLKTLVLVVVIAAMFASQADVIVENPGVVLTLLPALGVFFVAAFAVALAVARAAKLPYDQAALLAFTTTSRNSEASLAIAATAFTSPLVALTVVLGPIIELPFLVLMVRVLLANQKVFTETTV